jgi:tetratricopeptide (TPR) repeat protein
MVARLKSAIWGCSSWGWKLAAGMLVCACASAASAQTPANPRPPVDPASISSEEVHLSPALAAEEAGLRHESELHPDSADTLYKLALVLRQENKPRESLDTYTRAAKLKKPDAGQLRSVALDYLLLNDYPDAIHWLEAAASLDPHDVEVLYSLARCYYTQSEFHKAEGMYLRVLAIQPEHLKAEENLGLTYDAESQPEKAEAALRTAAAWAEQQTPGPASGEWPFLNVGAFLLDHDRPAEAVPFLQRATAIAAKSAICHEKLGRALEESGKAPEGVKELETAVGLDPKNPNVHFELGHAYRQVGEAEKARAEFAVSAELRKERDRQAGP